jgi:hypothetical protein
LGCVNRSTVYLQQFINELLLRVNILYFYLYKNSLEMNCLKNWLCSEPCSEHKTGKAGHTDVTKCYLCYYCISIFSVAFSWWKNGSEGGEGFMKKQKLVRRAFIYVSVQFCHVKYRNKKSCLRNLSMICVRCQNCKGISKKNYPPVSGHFN